MKIMIASDIHGSAYYCRKLLERFREEKAEKLLLLGDILYHGPRNELPREYDPKQVFAMLNERKEQILCVRGNCDSEVDQMVLEFPIMAQYIMLDDGEVTIFATHGHEFNIDSLPPFAAGGVLLYGHFHVPMCEERNGVICMNPGSAALPKDGSWNGYMMYEDGTFLWKDTEGKEKKRYCVKM